MASSYGHIRVRLRVSLIKNNIHLNQDERKPYFQFFFSRHITEDLKMWHTNDINSGEITMESRRVRQKIRQTHACIGISLMTHIIISNQDDHFNYYRYEPIGGGVIYLSDFINYRSGQSVVVDITDIAGIEEVESRLQVRITFLDISIDGTTLVGSLKERESDRRRMGDIVKLFLNRFRDDFVPSQKDLRKNHIPRYTTEVTKANLPASSFCFLPVHEFKRNNIRTLIEIQLKMDDWTEQRLVDTLRNVIGGMKYNPAEFARASKLLSNALCLFSNACDYVSDKHNNDDIERFIDVFLTLAGDCEDLARAIYVMAMILYDVNVTEQSDPLLFWAKKWVRLFVPCMIVGVASCAKMGGQPGEKEDICHIYSALIPRFHFVETLPYEDRDVVREALLENMPELPWERNNDLVLILEGTNFSDPIQMPRIHYSPTTEVDELARLETRRAELEGELPELTLLPIEAIQANMKLKNVLDVSETKISPFYRRITGLWTSLFLRHKIYLTDFTVGTGPQTGPANRSAYGIDFRKFISLDDSLTIVPVFELTKDDIFIIDDILAQEKPLQIQCANPPQTANSWTHPQLEQVKHHFGRINCAGKCYISYRVNHEQKLTHQVINAFIASKSKGATGFDYRKHTITDDGELYIIEIRLYV